MEATLRQLSNNLKLSVMSESLSVGFWYSLSLEFELTYALGYTYVATVGFLPC